MGRWQWDAWRRGLIPVCGMRDPDEEHLKACWEVEIQELSVRLVDGKTMLSEPGDRDEGPCWRGHAVVAAGVEGAFPGDDVEAFVLGVGVSAGAAAAAGRHDLVEEGACVVGLDSCGHDAPEVADLPVRGGVFGVGYHGS